MKAYEVITNKILEALDKGEIPWHRPWTSGFPMNLVTKRGYRGLNAFVLNMMGFESPYFLTYKEALKFGGNVKKGEKGCLIVFWKWVQWVQEKPEETEEKTETEATVPGHTLRGNGAGKNKNRPLLRYYTVFNVSQCENLPADKIPAIGSRVIDPIEQCEAVVAGMPERPEINLDSARAFYNSSTDAVRMPARGSFINAEEYYSTLFHELTHSTAHPRRLNRKGIIENEEFGSQSYGKEELIAEMGAAFLCGQCQIENKTIANQAAYIQGWLKALKNDKTMVIMAAAQAQKASDYIIKKVKNGMD